MRNRRGSILVEGVFGIGLGMTLMVMNWEVLRIQQMQAVLQHISFVYARQRGFGSGVELSRQVANGVLQDVFPVEKARRLKPLLHYRESLSPNRLRISVRVRHPLMMTVRQPDFVRHHWERTEDCSFQFSASLP